jgi:5-methylcytosine-specific restriction endonuclease McrA
MMNYIKFININKWKDLDKLHSIFCIDKALKYNCTALFITCDVDDRWCNNIEWIREFANNYYAMTPTPPPAQLDQNKKRKAMPKTIRTQVWQKVYTNSMIGECVCCQKQISYDTFEVGHIISVKNNGTSTIENLAPICALCNRSMGSTNMLEFCNTYSMPLNKTAIGVI